MTLTFGRIITAMATPFTPNNGVDYDEAIRLADFLFNTGSDSLVIAGTTGESPTLTHDEEFELFRILRTTFPSRKLIAGTGSNSTRTAIESTINAEKLGMDATLQVVPYYNRPSQEGCFQHFAAVANATQLPMMLYNIPGRTGRNLEPETIGRLAEIPSIFAIKESAGSVEQVRAIRRVTPADFLIYSGDDALTLPFMREGAVGVVSVAAHVAGLEMSAMISAFVADDFETAERINERLSRLFEVLFITSNPTPLKAALALMGFNMGDPRLPLIPATDAERELIGDALQKLCDPDYTPTKI
ncbi:4-hydroxy-tetrahydrodipicolinate synthase [bacterium]|nr:4-hydroxy-tetrahydrodipicolinate synthase [bacterium]